MSFIVNDNATQSFVGSYETRTGREWWKVNRQESQSWATPFVWENELRTEIVTTGTNKVRSYDLDGGLLWEMKGMTAYFNAHTFRQPQPPVCLLR